MRKKKAELACELADIANRGKKRETGSKKCRVYVIYMKKAGGFR